MLGVSKKNLTFSTVALVIVSAAPLSIIALREDRTEPFTLIETLPYTISESGSYKLSKSLHSACDGISVTADNVIIDLGNHVISGPQSPTTTCLGISAFNQHNLTVRNGEIRGFQYGIYLSGYSDRAEISSDLLGGEHLVERIYTHDNTFRGIRVEGTRNIVRNNIITDI